MQTSEKMLNLYGQIDTMDNPQAPEIVEADVVDISDQPRLLWKP